MPDLAGVIMAAGKGTRMKSKLPKVMHRLAGKAMLDHVLDLVAAVGIKRPHVVLGHGREMIEPTLSGRAEIVVQADQLGTGHAIMQVLPFLEGADDVLVLSGDQPLLRPETIAGMLELHRQERPVATVLTAELADPSGYGRVVREGNRLMRIVEDKDATNAERAIREINTGTYCFRVGPLREALQRLTPQNAQGEYYLTDVFSYFLAQGWEVVRYFTHDANEALGINSRSQLAQAERIVRERILDYWMNEGVTIVDPLSTYIEAEVELARDVTLLPAVHLRGNTKVAEDACLGPQVDLDGCSVGRGAELSYTVGKNAVIGEGCTVGPFAYLRPGTELASGVKVGDFVEIKNSRIGTGSKVPHLSYIGDAELGQGVNVGAGTITCNYDGVRKHPTKIGDHAFIGSNTNLVAPVEVGEYSMIGAGSTITKNVPPRTLAVERSTQTMRPKNK